MSLRPETRTEVPSSTAAVARAAFPRGNPYLRLRDALGTVFKDAQFAPLFPSRGLPPDHSWMSKTRGRLPQEVQRFYASFRYQAQTWSQSRRVVAKVEWHPGELYPRVGFLVTNLCRPPERVVAFYNQRGTAEQRIREGKNAAKWTRLSCRLMSANAVRLQLHALAYNLANFFRTLALPDEVVRWSLTTLREKVVKIGAKVITHARYTVFQMAEVAVPRDLLRRMLGLIDDLRPKPVGRC
jgi:hypothetical protein